MSVSVAAALVCAVFFAPHVRASDAAAPSAQVRSEIAALLALVENGGCTFLRNGTWHTAGDARKMLDHKLNVALRDPMGVPSSEHFIQKLASNSSMSGRPYMVRCGDAKPVESGTWLTHRLVEVRASNAARTSGATTPAPR